MRQPLPARLIDRQAGIITDIAIQNPTRTTMTFPSTSTVVRGVDEIMLLLFRIRGYLF